MANVSQRNSAAIRGSAEVSARHPNHLRSSACGSSSFLYWCIRDHQVLSRLPSLHLVVRRKTAILKIIKAQKRCSNDVRRLWLSQCWWSWSWALFPRCILFYFDPSVVACMDLFFELIIAAVAFILFAKVILLLWGSPWSTSAISQPPL